jgi:xylose isomerase
MAGAATNPDPDVFAFAAATVKTCIDATHQLGGENYVLWGGREGYETLLNTDLARERAQAGRFLQMVVEYKHKTGFKGTILIEPKPQEPSKHQYDYDVATVYGFLKDFGLEGGFPDEPRRPRVEDQSGEFDTQLLKPPDLVHPCHAADFDSHGW